MEEKNQIKQNSAIKTIHNPKEENKYYHNKCPKNKIYFNYVTGEEVNLECDNEDDMYYMLPDPGEYTEDKIENATELNKKDKKFFHLWNNFIKDKIITNNYKDFIIEFLTQNYKYIFENELKKNFLFHLIVTYENRQITEENIIDIIGTLNKFDNQYHKEKP